MSFMLADMHRSEPLPGLIPDLTEALVCPVEDADAPNLVGAGHLRGNSWAPVRKQLVLCWEPCGLLCAGTCGSP